MSISFKKGDKYICDICGEEHVAEWPDEEAKALFAQTSTASADDVKLVCEKCYYRIYGLPVGVAQ